MKITTKQSEMMIKRHQQYLEERISSLEKKLIETKDELIETKDELIWFKEKLQSTCVHNFGRPFQQRTDYAEVTTFKQCVKCKKRIVLNVKHFPHPYA